MPKINYSDESLDDCIHISPHLILFDFGIKDYQLEVMSNPQFKKILFKTSNSLIPFDLFGASFWFLTRYEEYLPHKSDKYNRFNYKYSLAFQYDFIDIPIVNLWLNEFKEILKTQFPNLIFAEREYNFLSSIDIDNAYKYKYKGFVRSLAGIVADRNYKKIKLRFQIILNKVKDPYDCYDFLLSAHKQFKIQSIYFFLLGDYGPNDKNHSASDLRFQSLIKHLADYSLVGIHPSFGSTNNLQQIKVETSRLTNITHKIITKSRQHFSILNFPQTYLNLIQAGILNDYSMGYKDCNGFRASYCFPFKWYSLDIESISALTINPFCLTENSLIAESDKQSINIEKLAKTLIDEVKKYNGQLISIFHNDSYNQKIKDFYLSFLKLAE